MSPTLHLIWINSVSNGADFILLEWQQFHDYCSCTGQPVRSEELANGAPGTKGMMGEENHTRLYDWWFIYRDANIPTVDIYLCKLQTFHTETHVTYGWCKGSIPCKSRINKLLAIVHLCSFTYKLRFFKFNNYIYYILAKGSSPQGQGRVCISDVPNSPRWPF